MPATKKLNVETMQLKKGMKFRLTRADGPDEKVGDIVTITTVTSIFKGIKSNGFPSDDEMIRVSNGKFSWRPSRHYLAPI